MIDPAAITTALDQWEATAQAATPGPWRVCAEGSEGSRIAPDYDSPERGKRERSRFIGILNGRVQPEDGYNAAHVALNDPARVLALVAGLRKAARLHAEGQPFYHPAGVTRKCAAGCHGAWPCPTLAALASVFAGEENSHE